MLTAAPGAAVPPAALPALLAGLEVRLPELLGVYRDLHANPELSFQEVRTARVVADLLLRQGWQVTEGVGGTGVVGVLRNGAGPVVLLRADMDALPVKEDTGLPYASTVVATGPDGTEVPVMHACGHDMHVTCLLGAAGQLAARPESWRGTVVAVFQPAEEVGGAAVMLDDGFQQRFPHPDVCLGQHVIPAPAGLVAVRPGPTMAASDNLKVTLFGKGGHGSMPETTIDPVVMAAAVVLRLQTVVSREVGAAHPAVVTVGSVRAGTKENIIPDTAELKINIRSASPAVRDRVLTAVRRIVRAEAAASGAPREPKFTDLGSFPLTVNDPGGTAAVHQSFEETFGEPCVLTLPQPLNGSEDFGVFGTTLGVPSVFWMLGGADPVQFRGVSSASLLTDGLPAEISSNHSPDYAPVPDPTLQLGVTALLAAAAPWLQRP